MELGAFVSLEDISDALPSYEEEVLSVEMDKALSDAYKTLGEDIKAALEEHRGNQSVMSTGLNALMLDPDRPFQIGTLFGYATSPDAGERERFVISDPADLDEDVRYFPGCLRNLNGVFRRRPRPQPPRLYEHAA